MWKPCLYNRSNQQFDHIDNIPQTVLSRLRVLNLAALSNPKPTKEPEPVFLIKTLEIENSFWTIAGLIRSNEKEIKRRFI